ncbi:MAG: RNA methyltransferase [Clostridia bacterium]|nr:RNA methyltransferase [Clostridia bacterium]
MEKLTAKDNPKIKETAHLSSNKRERKRSGLFVVEGLRLCLDACQSGVEIVNAFFTSQFINKHEKEAFTIQSLAANSYEITEELAKRLSDTETSQGVFLVCKQISATPVDEGKILILDGVSDPSNVGAIARSAEAFGITNLILTVGSADAFSPKALRASMGAFFRIPTVENADIIQTVERLKGKGYTVYGSVVAGFDKTVFECDFSQKTAMVIGNEAFGISDDARKVCDTLVTLPMKGRAESLNASAAAAVLLWEMTR